MLIIETDSSVDFRHTRYCTAHMQHCICLTRKFTSKIDCQIKRFTMHLLVNICPVYDRMNAHEQSRCHASLLCDFYCKQIMNASKCNVALKQYRKYSTPTPDTFSLTP